MTDFLLTKLKEDIDSVMADIGKCVWDCSDKKASAIKTLEDIRDSLDEWQNREMVIKGMPGNDSTGEDSVLL
jgi:hypothetical protein